ncbi:hypothetical protein, partial [Asaia sp. HN010]|uniref:hypothetical protein n=1 Tax=Asaia sp. HN010 TaxID=3081233 RepID=UPI00301A148F
AANDPSALTSANTGHSSSVSSQSLNQISAIKSMGPEPGRKEAVRWQKAIRAYITKQNYPLGVLVAFSG